MPPLERNALMGETEAMSPPIGRHSPDRVTLPENPWIDWSVSVVVFDSPPALTVIALSLEERSRPETMTVTAAYSLTAPDVAFTKIPYSL